MQPGGGSGADFGKSEVVPGREILVLVVRYPLSVISYQGGSGAFAPILGYPIRRPALVEMPHYHPDN